MRRAFFLIVLLVSATALQAEEPAVVYVMAGKLVDVRAGRLLENQVIVIRGERIEQVVPVASAGIPHGATVIDLTGATVLPGLIDAHDHLTGDHRFHGYRSLGVSVPRAALYGATNPRDRKSTRLYNKHPHHS